MFLGSVFAVPGSFFNLRPDVLMFILLATWVPSRSKLQCRFLKYMSYPLILCAGSAELRRSSCCSSQSLAERNHFHFFNFHSQVCFNTDLWARSAWLELVTCGACNTNNQLMFLAKKIAWLSPSKQQKPTLNQTTYTVPDPSSLEKLLKWRCSQQKIQVTS